MKRSWIACVLLCLCVCMLHGVAYADGSEGIDNVEDMVEWVVDTYIEPGMSDYEKALILYDWLCIEADYDYSLIYDGVWGSEYSPFDAEGPLLGGLGVCGGFAEAYELLLEEAGITAFHVMGYAKFAGVRHEWNIAKLDGEWYQFDVTWDEAGNGTTYDYFALTDYAMRSDHTQEGKKYLVCDAWQNNYGYRNGEYDYAIAELQTQIRQSIAEGNYSGSIELDYLPNRPARHTIAYIVSNDTDLDVYGNLNVQPSDTGYGFDFEFIAEETNVTSVYIEDADEIEDYDDYPCIYPGYEAQINVITEPAGVVVAYSSSNESVATISDTGLLTGVGYGEVLITITVQDYVIVFSVYCVPYYSFNVSPCLEHSGTLYVGETATIYARCRPYLFLGNNAVSLSSSNTDVATVTQDGVVNAIGYGTTIITAKTRTGFEGSLSLEVQDPAVFGDPEFTFPSAITVIKESAFEGIAARIVYIPDTCNTIGSYAFQNSNVVQIRIPENCVLGKDVFAGCDVVYIFGKKGSNAEEYCNIYDNCTFVAEK